MRGLFITLEGPDGSGKTTILERLAVKLREKNIDLLTTREPGGSKIGEQIREIILSNDNQELAARTEALLYAAARAQHVNQVIDPALDQGRLVISDRFLLSSLAYQGIGRGLGVDQVKGINDFAIGDLRPDLILFFNIDPEDTLRRKTQGDQGDRLENQGNSFHRRVFDGYKDLIKLYPENVEVIDARRSIEEVTDQVMLRIEKLIEERGNY